MRIYKLDEMRVICALAVLFSNLPIGSDDQAIYNVFVLSSIGLLGGHLGVELMLIMSGYFFMKKLMENGTKKVSRTLADRMISIYPLLLLTVTAGWIIFPDTPVMPLITTLYNVTSAEANYHDPYIPLWTLGVIVQFSIILAIAWKMTGNIRSMSCFLFIWIAAGIAIGFVLDVQDGERFLEFNYKSVFTRGVGMSIGGLIALYGVPKMSSRVAITMGLVSWITAVYCYSYINEMVAGAVPFTAVQLLLSVAGFSLVIFGLKSEGKKGTTVWSKLALYTFAFYVFQYPVLYMFGVFDGEQFEQSTIIIALFCCAVMSFLTEQVIASPIRKITRRKTKALN